MYIMKVSYNKDVAAQDHKWKKRHYIDDDKSTCTDYTLYQTHLFQYLNRGACSKTNLKSMRPGATNASMESWGQAKQMKQAVASRRHIIHVYTTYIAVV